MSQISYSIYTLLYFGFAVYSFTVWRRTKRWSTFFVFVVIAALIYDNGIIALGNTLGEGELLRILTVGRFCIHFTVTPLLIWTSLEQVRRSGYAWAGKPLMCWIFIDLIAALIVLGFVTEVHNIDLEIRIVDGVLRYMLPEAIFTAIVPVVGAIIALVIGGLLWRAQGWPWMFLGTLVIFISEGALRGSENVVLLVVQNGAEILYTLAYLQTEIFLYEKVEKVKLV
jgi:hypothetical protein